MTRSSTLRFAGLLTMSLLAWAGAPNAVRAELIGPSAYLAFDNSIPGAGSAISPFAGLSFSYFHLETFEDRLFNTPGVTASAGGVNSVVFGPNLHDSVDADDGVIDGSGLRGDSFFSTNGAAGIRFTFSPTVLGTLPTHAGLVWTDGAGTITFQAFGASGELLGTIGPINQLGAFPDAVFNGTTAEDRFFGATNAAGISSIFISNSVGGIEIDHLQYGALSSGPQVVPEPATVTLLGLGALAMIGYRARRRSDVTTATSEV